MKGESPDCDGCIPELHAANQSVIAIYNDVYGQFIMGQRGPVDINLDAVYRSMDEFDIPKHQQPETKDRVRNLVRHTIKKQAEATE